MSYRTLSADCVVKTIEWLALRISERFEG